MRRTTREYASDKIAKVLGSWTFVIIQLVICVLWMILNTIPISYHWDPFPFSMLANMLQIEGALAASFILISTNRDAERNEKKLNKDLAIAQHLQEEMDQLMKKETQNDKVQ